MNTEQPKTTDTIEYPYLPNGLKYHYVVATNEYMVLAKRVAREQALDTTMPTGTVLVKGNSVIGRGANGSSYHEQNVCERVRRNIPTGEGYDLCEGCHPRNHSEARAIEDANRHSKDIRGSDAYLWGHWWCCEPCWTALLDKGVSKVFLMQNSEILFNKNHASNIVGSQFND